ncbi:MAG: NeuD/PglB/VioB family sugar acetyltransferase [Candidatus Riflebacteria bacterium]|nr:NeuD/PglB/VioB family sugar acetyltransferase [Candidatus Riflebacteria bacterium]
MNENSRLIILGAGGHAKVLIETLQKMEQRVSGIATPEVLPDNVFEGIPVIGNDDTILSIPRDQVKLVNGLGSTGILGRRKSLYEKFKTFGYEFFSVIHPSAVIAANSVLMEGVQIMAGTVIQPGSKIGCNTIINTRASVDHDCKIGNHVHVSPGVTLSGGVEIDDCTHIGTGANVIQYLKIGRNSLIGAGALVIRNVLDQQMVTGVPAKLVKAIKDWRNTRMGPGTIIREAIKIIDSEALRIGLIVENDDILLGTVTDGDIRRAILRGVSLDAEVSSIMNSKPVVAREYESSERILALMKNKSVYQIPVIENQGRIIRVELLENFVYSNLL